MNNLKQLDQRGFTLIEMMIVLVIFTIIMAIAIPSYLAYARKSVAAQAEQQIQQLATELERQRSRNFNYRGFNPTAGELVVPVNATGNSVRYNISIVDGAVGLVELTAPTASGQSWVIRAISTDNRNFSYIMTSTGRKCKTLTAANITLTNAMDVSCGTTATGSQQW